MESKEPSDAAVSRIAAAIGEPARTRMLFCLMDGHARTSTELAIVAGITPSTASVHLHRLRTESLIKVLVQGKHRYYSLSSAQVAKALEGLNVLAGSPRSKFVPHTPSRLRAARTCYDHIAGTLGVLLHDRLKALGWLSVRAIKDAESYDLTAAGTAALESLGIDVAETRAQRRNFAYDCLDWSERKPHLGGALGAALLKLSLKKKWLLQDLDSRALSVTAHGRRQLHSRFGLSVSEI
jgi:DNA-binding transcriptional ArsR family regulator